MNRIKKYKKEMSAVNHYIGSAEKALRSKDHNISNILYHFSTRYGIILI